MLSFADSIFSSKISAAEKKKYLQFSIGKAEGIKGAINIARKYGGSFKDIVNNIVEEFHISQEEAIKYVKESFSDNDSIQKLI